MSGLFVNYEFGGIPGILVVKFELELIYTVIITPKKQKNSRNSGRILVFRPESTWNRWGSVKTSSFGTLAPVGDALAEDILRFTQPPTASSLPKKDIYDGSDYRFYLERCQETLTLYYCQPAYQSGGILWQLAMEATTTLGQIVDDVPDGPTMAGAILGDCFLIKGAEYYDDKMSDLDINSICGNVGVKGKHSVDVFVLFYQRVSTGTYWPLPSSWKKQRWGMQSAARGNLMWTHKDEEWYQRCHEICLAGQSNGQPKTQAY